MRTRRRSFAILIAFVTLLLTAGCVDFNIFNQSETTVRILIETPDGGNTTRKLEPIGYTNTFSEHGGSYKISVLPDAEYLQLLRQLRDEITVRLFLEGTTLTVEEVKVLVNRLGDIDSAIENASLQGASCSGAAPDFSTVNASIYYSTNENNWQISCSVAAEEE